MGFISKHVSTLPPQLPPKTGFKESQNRVMID